VERVPVHIGTSGWQYAHWKGLFYPSGLPQRAWLEHYAARFDTVELNNAFYRLPETESFARWRDRTPPDFVMAVKASRYLTHIRRLAEPAEAVSRLMERARVLGPKLGPVLVQLPGTLGADHGALDETLAAFGVGVRVAVELRNPSWFAGRNADRTAELLGRHGAALCLVDPPGAPASLCRTTDWGYVRFHRGRARPTPCYGRTDLATWARRLAALWEPEAVVYAYFNNDGSGCAPRDARRFAAAVRRSGLEPGRVPDQLETPVAG
jgi:uncharacterized protein YecE (DUF72 family)